IHTLYGSKWTGVLPYIPWAMATATAQALAMGADLLLVSMRQQRRTSILDLAVLVATAIALVVLAPKGLKLYLAGYGAVQILGFVVLLVWLCRLGAMTLTRILEALLPPAVSVLAAFAATEALVNTTH